MTYNQPTDHPLAIFYRIKPGSARVWAFPDPYFFQQKFNENIWPFK